MMVLKSNLTGMKSRLMENTHNLHYRDLKKKKEDALACKTIVKTCSFIVLCDLANIIIEVGCAQVKVRIMICKKKKGKKKVIIRKLTPMFVFDFVLKSHFYTGSRGIL